MGTLLITCCYLKICGRLHQCNYFAIDSKNDENLQVDLIFPLPRTLDQNMANSFLPTDLYCCISSTYQ